MKKRYLAPLAESLKGVNIAVMSNADQFAVIENIIALSDEQDAANEMQKKVIEQLKPEGFDAMDDKEREEHIHTINRKFNEYINTKMEEDSEIKLHKLSGEAISMIVSQAEGLATDQKALLVKILR